jgi:DNA repair protein RadA/Sms
VRAPSRLDSTVRRYELGLMKDKWIFACQQCGQTYSKWMGRCQECGAWNSVVEEKEARKTKGSSAPGAEGASKPLPVSQLATQEYRRYGTDLSEWDNVLGGGLVPGSVVLLGGEPGVGKSTLLLQVADQYAKAGKKILYVSGEESTSQIGLRSARLGVKGESLLVVSETILENVMTHVNEIKPDLLIIDSIQTIHSNELASQAGSVGQLRECANEIIHLAKNRSLATFLVGHVTKEGSIAGPKVLEHMVDVVLYFEGTNSQSFRMLRSIKNRFGSTNEVGVFEMVSHGMKQVSNPSELFLSERPQKTPGSVIVASLEGTRPLLVEIQALASSTSLAIPRRTAIGIDPNRVSLLCAILEKRGGFRLFDQDVYVNVAGGLRLNEPAADLGVLGALISSYEGKPADPSTVFFGEVGLGGEIRSVPRATERLREATRIGLTRAFVPAKVKKELAGMKDLEMIGLEHVQDLADKI